MKTLQSELHDLQTVARAMNKELNLNMADKSLNWPELDDDSSDDYIDDDAPELKDNERYLLCGHCDGLGCHYCKHTGIMQWPDTLREEADREEK